MTRILPLLLLLTTLQAVSQSNTNYRDIVRTYNKNLTDVNSSLLAIDSGIARQILINNDDIYLKLIEFDTMTVKMYLSETNAFLNSFQKLLNADTLPDSTKRKYIAAYAAQTQWYRQQQSNPGLGSCPTCFLIRKVRVTALKRVNDYRLDTVKCLNIDYQKIILTGIPKPLQTLNSFPCPEYEQLLATGPNYNFIVNYNGKKYTLTKSVNIGSAPTDIQEISLIIPKDPN